MKGLAVLGSTGTVGEATLDVAARHPDRFRIVALAAHSNHEALFAQVERHRPDCAALVDRQAAARLTHRIAAAGLPTRVLAGPDALAVAATAADVDAVMAAIVGAAGLASTLAAVDAGKQVLLANKEALVLAGPLLIDGARRSGATILPIDSEHNAVFQCLPPGCLTGGAPAGVTRIVLTASGGPFLRARREDLAVATPEQAVAHPNWRMGPKISVDSATLMNKGLELIEACHLFGLGPNAVRVVIHPQSIVHALVEYADGSVLAQMSRPDMRVPIAHALGWPERIDSGSAALDLIQIARLSFEDPDYERFPCLGLAQFAARCGGTMPAVLNAANEVAVAAFLGRRLNFAGIAAVIESVLQQHEAGAVTSLADALAADAWARERALRALDSIAKQAAGA
ncbi:MAG: 1-deoxy-D-xylulose-5-phosphate reductoisomerase [Gammaproteobacteria bacterium]|nr:1-deoxy-D-xylulose-5-phosphate reductoisomerase [Gammaproteobacteria bacterium]